MRDKIRNQSCKHSNRSLKCWGAMFIITSVSSHKELRVKYMPKRYQHTAGYNFKRDY